MTKKQDQIFDRISRQRARHSGKVKADNISARMPGSDKQKLAAMEQMIEVLRQRLRDNGLSDEVR